jgi:hypothetical protein
VGDVAVVHEVAVLTQELELDAAVDGATARRGPGRRGRRGAWWRSTSP